MRVDIEPDEGEMKVFTKPLVVESVTNKWEQLPVEVARRIKADVQPGDEIEIDVTPQRFRADRGADGQAGDDAEPAPGREGDDLR